MNLLALRRRFLADLDALDCRLRAREEPGVNGYGDAYDHAAHSQQRDEAFSRREALLRDGDAIRLAIERIDCGTYGVCDDCQRPIAP